MILSTKLVRIDRCEGVCSVCGSDEVKSSEVVSGELFCLAHTVLEDLDPDWPANQKYIRNANVSRVAAFPLTHSINDMITKREMGLPRGELGIWCGADAGIRLRTRSVEAKPFLAQYIYDNALYGKNAETCKSLDRFYYLQIIRKDDVAYLYLKFQEISGSRLLCVVPWDGVVEFFGVKA